MAVADRQWGVVSLAQLRELGVSTSAAEHWLRRRLLRRMHRGVYAVGHRELRAEGRWLAAVLACGEGAVLSHASVAALWGLRPTAAAAVDVTARGGRRARPGIRTHESRRLAPGQVAVKDGIPVTAIPRTLLDLAATISFGELESVLARAQRRPDFDAGALADAVAGGAGHRGVGALARALAVDARFTRSELERRFLALVRRAGLPAPETNVWWTLGAGEEWELDALWRDRRVSVELDGWRHHRDRLSFERDRVRAATMAAAGYRHLQFTWHQVTGDPAWVLRTLRSALGA